MRKNHKSPNGFSLSDNKHFLLYWGYKLERTRKIECVSQLCIPTDLPRNNIVEKAQVLSMGIIRLCAITVLFLQISITDLYFTGFLITYSPYQLLSDQKEGFLQQQGSYPFIPDIPLYAVSNRQG